MWRTFVLFLAFSDSNRSYIRGLVFKEIVVLRRWGVETNVWFINRVDKSNLAAVKRLSPEFLYVGQITLPTQLI